VTTPDPPQEDHLATVNRLITEYITVRAEIETEEQHDERGMHLLSRLCALDLTPAEQHEALVFLSGFSMSGVEAALDRCERQRREALAENGRT
jgi:hypothetical protein